MAKNRKTKNTTRRVKVKHVQGSKRRLTAKDMMKVKGGTVGVIAQKPPGMAKSRGSKGLMEEEGIYYY